MELEVIRVDDLSPVEFSEERISGSLLAEAQHCSAAIGIVAVGESQTPHYHERPDDGAELIFVYAGAFALISDQHDDVVYDVEERGPVFIQVPSGIRASLKNAGANEVRFLSVFAPPFRVGEINYLDPDEA